AKRSCTGVNALVGEPPTTTGPTSKRTAPPGGWVAPKRVIRRPSGTTVWRIVTPCPGSSSTRGGGPPGVATRGAKVAARNTPGGRSPLQLSGLAIASRSGGKGSTVGSATLTSSPNVACTPTQMSGNQRISRHASPATCHGVGPLIFALRLIAAICESPLLSATLPEKSVMNENG